MREQAKFPCPCCGYYTLANKPPGTFAICPVCFWEDDRVQFYNPDYYGGANRTSLNEARTNYQAFGYAKERSKEYVRPPMEDEYPPGGRTP